MSETEILKVLVGSQAHGLANKDSDFDYRAVFVVPTSELLSLGAKPKTTSWLEGKEDNTSWELAHFLNMAYHCNPTILECFLAPLICSHSKTIADDTCQAHHPLAFELRALFPHVWNSVDVSNAFVGYGLNQRKKFLDDKEGRGPKFAVAYLRTLYQAYELLTTGTFTVRIGDLEVIGELLKDWKAGKYDVGEVVGLCYDWEQKVKKAFKDNPDKQTNREPINEFLLKVRKENWQRKD